uniref:Reverse transcriptase domain-containing protein n=1 Tax=Chromera velia CCMP2878 TaxID=1169474 RepID=A0A0G4HQU1_9ALVE|eukprot:Cvel_1268.t1-p1 / transcript=Cvel_1268.t1 / gene=Cvel_1268 / organism=Chromera_velia_CCMP2878 / gene_product=hypothetical protein / transcript_product=hypothetical protein / location=Cvel_scaffold42:138200-139243(-) / protein_length=348 / sequence_SO=supercontig / SO=protein_coding / is_pseudo=false
MVAHVDDLLVFSADPLRDFASIRKRLQMDEPEILVEGGEMGYTGLEVKKNGDEFVISQEGYLSSIPVEKESLPRKNLSFDLLAKEEEKDESLITVMQKVMGILGWVCRTSVDLAFLFSELSRYNSCPTGAKLTAALLAFVRVKEKGETLRMNAVVDPKIALFVDAAYSLVRCEERSGFECYLVDEKETVEVMRRTNLVAWKSKRIKRKLISSTSAELCALVDGMKQAFQWNELVSALWGKSPSVEIYTDSAPLLAQLESGSSKREPRMDGLLKYVWQELRALRAKVSWVSTKDQRADKHTKFIVERVRRNSTPSVERERGGAVEPKRKILNFAKSARATRFSRVARMN